MTCRRSASQTVDPRKTGSITIASCVLVCCLWMIRAEPLFAQIPIRFIDVGAATHSAIDMNPHGSSFCDFTGDTLPDVFIVSNVSVGSHGDLPHALLKQTGDGLFTNIYQSAHLVGYYVSAQGMAAGDYDNDGDMDAVIGKGNFRTLLYRNNGDETFTDVSVGAGVNIGYQGRCLVFCDYDQDSYLDLFVLCQDGIFLLQNDGDGTFTNRNVQAGLVDPAFDNEQNGFAFCDTDHDGDMDFFLPHNNHACLFFQNNGDGTFSERAAVKGRPTGAGYKGAIFFDFDNDGWSDLFLRGPGETASLYRNDGDGTFSDVTAGSGVSLYVANAQLQPGGALSACDFDNDGYLDILVLCYDGVNHRLFRNNGDGTFTDVAVEAEVTSTFKNYWSAPIADYDGDGYPDVYMARGGDTASLYRNQGGTAHWLHAHLHGIQSNRNAIGARATAHAGGMKFTRQITGGTGWKTDSFPIEFGLNEQQFIDSLVVVWPSGIVQRILNIPADTLIHVTEQEGTQSISSIHDIVGTVSYYGQTNVPNVSLEMAGDTTLSILSNAEGLYRFSQVTEGVDVTVTPDKSGDEDVGSLTVSAYDAALTARYNMGLGDFDDDQIRCADVDENGVVDMFDASLIARQAVTLPRLPSSHAGEWRFVPESRMYVDLSQSYMNDDYTAYVLGDVNGDWMPAGGLYRTGGSYGVASDSVLIPESNVVCIPLCIPGSFDLLSMDIVFAFDPRQIEFIETIISDQASGFKVLQNLSEVGRIRIALYGQESVSDTVGPVCIALRVKSDARLPARIEWETIRLNDLPVQRGSTVLFRGDPEVRELDIDSIIIDGGYPNPFNSSTTIRYRLHESGSVHVCLFDIRGRAVRILVRENQERGEYNIPWDGKNESGETVPSGIYLARVRWNTHHQLLKILKQR